VKTKFLVFWAVAPCSVVAGYQGFGVPCCLHFLDCSTTQKTTNSSYEAPHYTVFSRLPQFPTLIFNIRQRKYFGEEAPLDLTIEHHCFSTSNMSPMPHMNLAGICLEGASHSRVPRVIHLQFVCGFSIRMYAIFILGNTPYSHATSPLIHSLFHGEGKGEGKVSLCYFLSTTP
jgi:hypothetical protein